MRFDTTRALHWVDAFAFARSAGTEGERRAAALVSEALAGLGLEIEQVEVRGSQLRTRLEPWFGWLGVGAWAAGLELAAWRGAGWPVRLGLSVGALLWLRLTAVEGFGLGRLWPRRVGTTSVLARRGFRGPGEPPQVRVVFHTALDSFDPGRELVPVWLGTPVLAALLGLQIFFALTINRSPLGLPRWCGHGAGVVAWLLLAAGVGMRLFRCVWGRGCADARDNRTGLALLVELARGWPAGTDARLETRFAATGGRALDHAGLQALLRAIEREWSPKPTLVVDWLAPGIGPGLELLEQGTEGLATEAAADLWIPHQMVHRTAVRREHWPFGRHGPGYIGMVGNGVASPAPPAVAPEAIGRAAQLATEIALRWAKKKQVPDVKTVAS